jgi:flagellar motility protein MotE (MotC chaperone)
MALTEAQLLLAEIREVKQTLNSAPVLNGGFSKLVATVEHIKEEQKQNTETLKEFKEILYKPDVGLFARMHDVETCLEKLKVEELKDLKENTQKIRSLISTEERLKEISGKGLDDLKDTIEQQKNWKKIKWLLITTTAATIGKVLFDIIFKA